MIISLKKAVLSDCAQIHKMNLWHDPFEKIKARTKTIEMRLYDEKR